MVFQKKTINNVPTLVPLTADTGSGVPVGTIIGQYKKVNMAGYLYLDGSTFDQTLYPALYAYLGTNVLPDYREFVLVGAEQNTTSATIAVHDVFTQGQEKDDQLQDHAHNTYVNGDPNFPFKVSNGYQGSSTGWSGGSQYNLIAMGVTSPSMRTGTTTRTKEKAVFWYIKATTGIIESEATEMLNVFNNRMFPDYAHPITIPDVTLTWTATEDCYIQALYTTTDTTMAVNSRVITIDGQLVGTSDTTSTVATRQFSGYVKKGQVVSSYDQTLNLGFFQYVKVFPLSS